MLYGPLTETALDFATLNEIVSDFGKEKGLNQSAYYTWNTRRWIQETGFCPLDYVTRTMSLYGGLVSYTLFLSVWLQVIKLGKYPRIVSFIDFQSLNQHLHNLPALGLLHLLSTYVLFQNVSQVKTFDCWALFSQHLCQCH